MPTARALLLTALAMLAFAANSVLTRYALAPGLIDPASFSSVRVGSAALTLVALLLLRGAHPRITGQAVWPALMLVGYVVFFSFAYLSLTAGTGALILFGMVQLTMFGIALGRGERFGAGAWIGLVLAFGGLIYLLLPGIEAPDLLGTVLMAVAGIAWGLYSLAGKGVRDPLSATAANFLLALPVVLTVSAMTLNGAHVSPSGMALAVASGAVASGMGYAIWYAALPALGTGQAGIVQLSVPVIAAIGGVVLLSEPMTLRLVIASALILGGVALALIKRR